MQYQQYMQYQYNPVYLVAEYQLIMIFIITKITIHSSTYVPLHNNNIQFAVAITNLQYQIEIRSIKLPRY